MALLGTQFRWTVEVGVAILFGIAGFDASRVSAGATPVAHIHEGSCSALGAVAYELGPPDDEMQMDDMPGMAMSPTPMATDEMSTAAAMPTPLAVTSTDGALIASVTDLPIPMTSLLDGNFAVNVHEDMDDITSYIACGNLANAAAVGDTAVVALHELDDSGWSGIGRAPPITE